MLLPALYLYDSRRKAAETQALCSLVSTLIWQLEPPLMTQAPYHQIYHPPQDHPKVLDIGAYQSLLLS